MASPISTWILYMKVVLISAVIVSIGMSTKFSVPLIIDFAVYEVPLMWSTLVFWLKPPYLYLIINGIIITIAASSRFYQKLDHHTHSQPLVSPKPLPSDVAAVSNQSEFRVLEPPVVYEDEARVSEVNRESVNGLEVGDGDEDEDKFVISTESDFRVMESLAVYEDEANFPGVNHEVMSGSEVDDIQDEDKYEISNSTRMPPPRRNSSEIQTEYLFPATEKPPVSARFGHRKPPKASPEGGRALKVAKPKRHETLETTWKMITDGRHMPLTRHLRRSESWENHDRHFNAGPHDSSPNNSETAMVDQAYYDPPSSSSGKLRKEPSPSQDELNRRVEAFIKRFKEDIKLQREESLKRYMEMINRGAH